MSRCLSDKALMRVVAELGTESDKAHLAGCVTCTGRYRRITGEVDLIRQVLVTTTEPGRRAVSRWRSVAAVAAFAAAGVAALVWVEVTAWKAIQPEPDLAQAAQMSATLADVTAALFSVDGEPKAALADGPAVVALEQEASLDSNCDEGTALDEADCAAVPSGLEAPGVPGLEDADMQDPGLQDPLDAIEVEAPERTVLETDNLDQGG